MEEQQRLTEEQHITFEQSLDFDQLDNLNFHNYTQSSKLNHIQYSSQKNQSNNINSNFSFDDYSELRNNSNNITVSQTEYNEECLTIKNTIQRNPLANENQILKLIHQRYNILYSKDQLNICCRKLHYKYQSYLPKKLSRNGKDQIQLRQKYAFELKNSLIQGKTINYASFCQLSMNQFKGQLWQKIQGENSQILIQNDHLLTLVIVMSQNGVQEYGVFEKEYQTQMGFEIFTKWKNNIRMKKQQVKEKEPQKIEEIQQILIVDKSLTQQNDLQLGNVEIKILPPFSPLLNPSQIIFNTIRYKIRQNKPKSIEYLKKSIHQIINNEISTSDIKFTYRDLEICLLRSYNKRQLA